MLREVTEATNLNTTLRVAGGWVRDKLLSTPAFQTQHNGRTQGERLTSKAKRPAGQASMGRQGTKIIVDDVSNQPVDIDIALDDMLGREFADHLNQYLSEQGQEKVSVGVVLKNPEKSKHLETATMKVGTFWIDFVNLRAEEYTQDSRIPDLMRIGTPHEDAARRDLTINALFYNINEGTVEDFTGRGLQDLKRGIVSTPLAPLTTLLDDPLRVLRSVRFAARLRFLMDDALIDAAKDLRVRTALAQKVSRERVGGEVDLMLRSPDAVGAMSLLINLNLAPTVFPIENVLPKAFPGGLHIYTNGLHLLSTAFQHLCECKSDTPLWCKADHAFTTHGYQEHTLLTDDESRRLLWYAAFLKPLLEYSSLLDYDMNDDTDLTAATTTTTIMTMMMDGSNNNNDASKQTKPKKAKGSGKKSKRSVISKLLVDELKRPARDAENVEKIMTAANDFTVLLDNGLDAIAKEVLLNDVRVQQVGNNSSNQQDKDKPADTLQCSIKGRTVCSETEEAKEWQRAMQFRLLTSKVLQRVGTLWRPAFMLSLAQQLVALEDNAPYAIEGDVVSRMWGLSDTIRYDTTQCVGGCHCHNGDVRVDTTALSIPTHSQTFTFTTILRFLFHLYFFVLFFSIFPFRFMSVRNKNAVALSNGTTRLLLASRIWA